LRNAEIVFPVAQVMSSTVSLAVVVAGWCTHPDLSGQQEMHYAADDSNPDV
jgi:hypothetical protein